MIKNTPKSEWISFVLLSPFPLWGTNLVTAGENKVPWVPAKLQGDKWTALLFWFLIKAPIRSITNGQDSYRSILQHIFINLLHSFLRNFPMRCFPQDLFISNQQQLRRSMFHIHICFNLVGDLAFFDYFYNINVHFYAFAIFHIIFIISHIYNNNVSCKIVSFFPPEFSSQRNLPFKKTELFPYCRKAS